MGFNKTLLLLVSLCSLLLSNHATPSPYYTLAPSPKPTTDSSIFIQAFPAVHVFKPDPEVTGFCSGTENPTLCAETIAPYFHNSFDPLRALQIEIEATLKQSVKVAGIIAESLADPSTNQNALDALDICKSQYKSIVETIKEAAELLNQQNVVDAYYKFSAVISDHSACEDAFLESPRLGTPFADDSLTVFQLGGNCLAMMDGIVNSRSDYLV